MAEHIHHTNDNTSSATILVSVVIVLIVALAFYFGVIRGNVTAPANTSGDTNVELNVPGAGGSAGADTEEGGVLNY
jgi:hypothetical protein